MIKLLCSLLSLEREKKLTNLDENAIRDLVGEFDKEDEPDKAAEASKKQKATNKVQARLAQEKKADAKKAASKKKKKGKGADDDDDMDEDDLSRFANPTKAKTN
jgi:hypothetical protein